MGSARRQFDPEFGAGAVRIVTETGKSVAQAARDLGISPYTLQNWVRTARRQTQAQRPLIEDERAWQDRLRAEKAQWAKEKAELEMERDVLKHSVGLWVKMRWTSDRGGVHRVPEDRFRRTARDRLPGAGGLAVLVLQVDQPQAHRS
ncbi:transposase [Kibdelosporangium lantanae]|uniref:Transposase n=1 Tax=Kibdelosporangium lantanae TaxID=1497396 RepID=A0ABW3M876_9PSEU